MLCWIRMPASFGLVKMKQHKFIQKMYSDRVNLVDDPVIHAIGIVRRLNTLLGRLVNEYITENVIDFETTMGYVHWQIIESTTSRCEVYKTIDPELSVHIIYKEKKAVNELYMISFTCLRVSGHNLCIETGRWNRRGRGRIPVEKRLCECAAVQTEHYIMQDCPISSNFRDAYHIVSVETCFRGVWIISLMCKVIHDVLKLYM